MVRASSERGSGSAKRPTLGFLVSVLVARFATQARHLKIKLKAKPIKKNGQGTRDNNLHDDVGSRNANSVPPSPRSPTSSRSKKLIASLSDKAITLIHPRQKKNDAFHGRVSHDELGDGGVWQKAILMGDKCQPLNFSGVIYYDCTGRQVNELPLRSPSASPLPRYRAGK